MGPFLLHHFILCSGDTFYSRDFGCSDNQGFKLRYQVLCILLTHVLAVASFRSEIVVPNIYLFPASFLYLKLMFFFCLNTLPTG